MLMKDTLRYELPPEGTSLLGYVVRRMHKTVWLLPVRDLLAAEDAAQALAHVAMYAITASTSFGRAFYQPRFDAQADHISEPDPVTGALVTARLEAVDPHYVISYEVQLPNGGSFKGREEITGTTIGLRGIGMPAPSRFSFTLDSYSAGITGLLTSELALSLIGKTRIRALGSLNAGDSAGNTGKVSVDRAGRLSLEINGRELVLEEPASIGALQS